MVARVGGPLFVTPLGILFLVLSFRGPQSQPSSAGGGALGVFMLGLCVIVIGLLPLFIKQFRVMSVKRITKDAPFLDTEVVMRFDESGVAINDEHGKSENSWRTFTEAVAYPDGWGLKIGVVQLWWIPKSSLVDPACAERLDQLFRTRLERYRQVRRS